MPLTKSIQPVIISLYVSSIPTLHCDLNTLCYSIGNVNPGWLIDWLSLLAK